MAQKTALDRYRAKLLSVALVSNSIRDVFENEEKYFLQAKEIEKFQIINAWLNGDADSMYDPKQLQEQAEQYYNEAYGSNN